MSKAQDCGLQQHQFVVFPLSASFYKVLSSKNHVQFLLDELSKVGAVWAFWKDTASRYIKMQMLRGL